MLHPPTRPSHSNTQSLFSRQVHDSKHSLGRQFQTNTISRPGDSNDQRDGATLRNGAERVVARWRVPDSEAAEVRRLETLMCLFCLVFSFVYSFHKSDSAIPYTTYSALSPSAFSRLLPTSFLHLLLSLLDPLRPHTRISSSIRVLLHRRRPSKIIPSTILVTALILHRR